MRSLPRRSQSLGKCPAPCLFSLHCLAAMRRATPTTCSRHPGILPDLSPKATGAASRTLRVLTKWLCFFENVSPAYLPPQQRLLPPSHLWRSLPDLQQQSHTWNFWINHCFVLLSLQLTGTRGYHPDTGESPCLSFQRANQVLVTLCKWVFTVGLDTMSNSAKGRTLDFSNSF